MRTTSPHIGPLWRSYGRHLRELHGEPVAKLMLDAGFTCPNIDGTKARGGCTYCDAHGSGPGPEARVLPLGEQLDREAARARSGRLGARRFIAYFQAYTNTHAPVERLRELYTQAVSYPDVVGLSTGTRADSVPDDVLDLLREFAGRTDVQLELGLQSASDETLRRTNRAETVAEFVDAVERAHARQLSVCAHVIFGFPWETRDMMMATTELVASLRLEGVKLHNLYLVRGTSLHDEVMRDGLPLLEQAAYASLAADALERLPPETIIHRLTGDPPHDIPAIPAWTGDKSGTLRLIEAELRARGTRQGSGWRGAPSG